MTKLADLRSRFVAWDTALTQYNQTAELVMLAFYSGFCQYLGHNPATDGHVVDLHKINLAAEGLSQHVAVDHFSEALSQDDKGLWHFGITITLQEGTSFEQQLSTAAYTAARGKEVPITMPRFARFHLHIQFSLRDTECNFQNARETTKTFPFKFTNNILVGPPDAYAYLAGILDTIFSTKPGEPPVSQPIGFDLGSRH